jgi:transposase-like protein
MDLKEQIIKEYLAQGGSYRQLASKYGIGSSTICRWIMIQRGIHNLLPSEKQLKYYPNEMKKSVKKSTPSDQQSAESFQQKIAALEKQLQWEKLRADALDIMINIAEKQLDIQIRKKPGTHQSKK